MGLRSEPKANKALGFLGPIGEEKEKANSLKGPRHGATLPSSRRRSSQRSMMKLGAPCAQGASSIGSQSLGAEGLWKFKA